MLGANVRILRCLAVLPNTAVQHFCRFLGIIPAILWTAERAVEISKIKQQKVEIRFMKLDGINTMLFLQIRTGLTECYPRNPMKFDMVNKLPSSQTNET